MTLRYIWDRDKNEWLKAERGVSFENMLHAMTTGGLLDTVDHPHPERYPGQRIYIVLWNQYVYDVPFVDNGVEVILKTIIPNRKATRKHRKGGWG